MPREAGGPVATLEGFPIDWHIACSAYLLILKAIGEEAEVWQAFTVRIAGSRVGN